METFIAQLDFVEMGKRSDETGLRCEDESLTDQSTLRDTDINFMMKQYGVTGQMIMHDLPPLNDDFSAAFGYKEMLELSMAAKASFAALPAQARSFFDNDPVKFVDFCSDEKNVDQMRLLGIANPVPKADSTPES